MPFCPDVVKILAAHGQGKAVGTGFFLPVDGAMVKEEGLIVTNAHVVTGSPAISVQTEFIEHQPMKANVISICHDRDLALLKLEPQTVQRMRRVLHEEYGLDHIPVSAGFGDSNTLRQGDPIEAVGYPLGIQQQHTYGVHQGYVVMGEQVRVLSGAQINGGNSGGPAFRKLNVKADKVVKMKRFNYQVPQDRELIGINTFKLTGENVGGENGHIAINDVLQMLPTMIKAIDEGNEIRQKLMTQIMAQLAAHTQSASASQVNAAAAAVVDHLTEDEQSKLCEHMETLQQDWTEHKLGGTVRGAARPFGMWMWRHIFDNGKTHFRENAETLLSFIVDNAHDAESMKGTKWAEMRDNEEQEGAPQQQQVVIQLPPLPPKHIYEPTLGLYGKPIYSADMLYHYRCPVNDDKKWIAQGGAIMTHILPGTLFANAGGKEGDLVHSIQIADNKVLELGPSASAYYEPREMSLSLIHLCHTAKIGDTIKLGVLRRREGMDAHAMTLDFEYRHPKTKELPSIRKVYPCTDEGAAMVQQKCAVQGIQLAPLRLDHVQQFGLVNFALPQERYQFKVVVTNVSPESPAYHNSAVSPGAILTHINEVKTADNWNDVLEQLKKPHQDTGCWVLTTERAGESVKFAMKVV